MASRTGQNIVMIAGCSSGSNEINTTPPPPPPNLPNLIDRGYAYSSAYPIYITAGQAYQIHVDVENRQFNGDDAGAFFVSFYASTNTTISTSDYYLGNFFVSGLAAFSYADAQLISDWPSNIPTGKYYIGWIIDSESDVPETNETDNNVCYTGNQITVQ